MRAFRKEYWKALKLPTPYGSGTWELYNLKDDPAETDNVATENDLMLKEFIASWESYARENGVVEPDEPVSYAKKPKPDSY